MKRTIISKVLFCTLILCVFLLVHTTSQGQDSSGNDIQKEGLKVGVVKNSSLVKVEVKGKAEVLNLKELYSYLGINKLDRTYRTLVSLEQMKVQGNTANIDGEALLSVISGKDGIIILIADANDPKNFTYTALKQKIVRKGDTKDLYHSQEDGIQRPDLVTISSSGIAWVSYDESELYALNYVPLVTPKLITTTFEGSKSTQEWDIKVIDGNISVVDGSKTLLKATVYNGFSDVADNMTSLVKWGGKTRNVNDFTFNIVEDTRSMAGNDVLLEFGENDLSKLCNPSSKTASWESVEIVKPLNDVIRDKALYIPHVVIARNGIGVVEVPTEGDVVRYYHLGNKPYDPNEKDNPKIFKPAYSINTFGTLFGYIEVSDADAKTQQLALFSPTYRFGIKVELSYNVKKDFSVFATSNHLSLKEGDGNVRTMLGINNLQMN
jgi:hypothetical protein